MEKKKADFKAGKSLVVSVAPTCVCVWSLGFLDVCFCGHFMCVHFVYDANVSTVIQDLIKSRVSVGERARSVRVPSGVGG